MIFQSFDFRKRLCFRSLYYIENAFLEDRKHFFQTLEIFKNQSCARITVFFSQTGRSETKRMSFITRSVPRDNPLNIVT